MVEAIVRPASDQFELLVAGTEQHGRGVDHAADVRLTPDYRDARLRHARLKLRGLYVEHALVGRAARADVNQVNPPVAAGRRRRRIAHELLSRDERGLPPDSRLRRSWAMRRRRRP